MILHTDSYKFTHWEQLPPEAAHLMAYFSARGGPFPETVHHGLQAILIDMFGQRISMEAVRYAKSRVDKHLGPGHFNLEGWTRIVQQHHGWLPLQILAVPEGTRVPLRNAIFTVENTDPLLPWLTTYVETVLSQVWYPSTIATNGWQARLMFKRFLEKTVEGECSPDHMLHDFGFRGASSVQSAGIGGCAHLLNFRGTDTFEGVEHALRYYGCEMAGDSIPATEHSTIMAWGTEHEAAAFEHMLQRYPNGPLAVVSDTYDFDHACEKLWGDLLREKVVGRSGVLVIRPDSGSPPVVVAKALATLGQKFGFSTNSKKFKVLDPHVRLIWGDGLTLGGIERILNTVVDKGWSVENICFGMGSGLLQEVRRDDYNYAYKACHLIRRDGTKIDLAKTPVGSPLKHSKGGRLMLYKGPKGFRTGLQGIPQAEEVEALLPVYTAGARQHENTLEQIRERLRA